MKTSSEPAPAGDDLQRLAQENSELLQDMANLETQLRTLKQEKSELQDRLLELDADRRALQNKAQFEGKFRQTLGEILHRMDMVTRLYGDVASLDMESVGEAAVTRLPFIVDAQFGTLYSYNAKENMLKLEKSNIGPNTGEIAWVDLKSDHPKPGDRTNGGQNIEDYLSPFPKSAAVLRIKIPHNQTLFDFLFEGKIQIAESAAEQSTILDLLFENGLPKDLAALPSVLVPLKLGKVIVGILWLAGKTEGTKFDEKHELYPLQEIQVLLSTSMQNSRLYKEVQLQARLDGSTGLLNHTAFFEELDRELHRAKRFGQPLSLIILDLDNFKHINDAHGHPCGDKVLVEVANLIKDCLRGVDRPARFGGDEFSVILPQTSHQGASILGHRLMDKIRCMKVKFGELDIPVSASMGIAEMSASYTKEELFEKADNALLEAKRKGKNQVVIAIASRE